MKNIKFLSFILAFVFVFSVFPFNTVYAVENTENAANTQETQEFTLPDIVDTTEARERGYVGRVKDEEKDNYTFVFQNSDNTRTMRVYSHPVKYTDKDGNTKDITLDIQSRTGGGFETKDNSIKTTFGKRLSDGIRLQHEEVDVKLIPANSPNLATLSADSKTVSYVLDEKTTLEYSLTYTGFKEDIVVSEYTGQTEYGFLLYTNGLTVKEEMGSHYLADSEGNRKANIGDIIIFTADERNNTLGELTYTEVKPNQIYLLTIHIDAEYLADEDTVYPIRIDPTLEVNGTGAIEDVTVYTGSSYYSGTSGILYVGTDDSKVYRALMRFPNLNVSHLHEDYIAIAKIEMRDVMCQGIQVPIECHRYTALPGMWIESGTTTWNSVGGDAYVGELLDEQTVYYGNGNTPSDSQRYSFNITSVVKQWAENRFHPGMGVIFKASDEIEDEATTSTVDRLKYFGSYNRSDYKPSMSIIYSNPFEGFSSDINRYINSNGLTSDDELQRRANCYGFALKMHYGGEFSPYGGSYFQQPGEFALKHSANGTKTFDDLYDEYFELKYGDGITIDFVMNYVSLDMQAMGYSVLSTAKYTEASEIPSADTYQDRRLILLVVGQTDYHFYMQNGDDTWSHKRGNTAAQNSCAGGCASPVTSLNNDNILAHWNDAGYTHDYIFFYVDKPATVDFAHENGHASTETQTEIITYDLAGDRSQAFMPVSSNIFSGRIDFVNDNDWLGLVFNEYKTVTLDVSAFYGESQQPYSLTIALYDSSTTPIQYYTFTGEKTLTFTAYPHCVYLLWIQTEGQYFYEQDRLYTVYIS